MASRHAQGSASAVMVDAGGGASQPAAAASGASQPDAQELLQQVRDLGRYPKERSPAERQLARKLRRARKEKQFSLEQEAELQALQQAELKTVEAQQKADLQRRQKTEVLLQQVRDLGRYPKENAGRSLAERQLAEKIRRARKAKQISPEQEAELKALQQAESDARVAARIAEAEELPNPMEGFAEEAHSRIDQDLLMLESGIRTKVRRPW